VSIPDQGLSKAAVEGADGAGTDAAVMACWSKGMLE
jgi:hypothetical protein